MEQNFSTQRFQSLFLRYWAEDKIVLLFLIILSIPLVYFYETSNGRIQLAGGFITGALSVFIIAFLVLAFKSVDTKKRSAYFLLLPASRIEKFVFLLLVGFILPYLLLLLELFVIKGILYFLPLDLVRRSEEVSTVENFYSIQTFFNTGFVFTLIIMIRFLNKNHTILRSFFVMIGGTLIISFIDRLIVQLWFGNYFNSSPFGKMEFGIGDKALIGNGLYVDFLPYSMVLLACFWFAMLYLAFSKFNEMEKGL